MKNNTCRKIEYSAGLFFRTELHFFLHYRSANARHFVKGEKKPLEVGGDSATIEKLSKLVTICYTRFKFSTTHQKIFIARWFPFDASEVN